MLLPIETRCTRIYSLGPWVPQNWTLPIWRFPKTSPKSSILLVLPLWKQPYHAKNMKEHRSYSGISISHFASTQRCIYIYKYRLMIYTCITCSYMIIRSWWTYSLSIIVYIYIGNYTNRYMFLFLSHNTQNQTYWEIYSRARRSNGPSRRSCSALGKRWLVWSCTDENGPSHLSAACRSLESELLDWQLERETSQCQTIIFSMQLDDKKI